MARMLANSSQGMGRHVFGWQGGMRFCRLDQRAHGTSSSLHGLSTVRIVTSSHYHVSQLYCNKFPDWLLGPPMPCSRRHGSSTCWSGSVFRLGPAPWRFSAAARSRSCLRAGVAFSPVLPPTATWYCLPPCRSPARFVGCLRRQLGTSCANNPATYQGDPCHGQGGIDAPRGFLLSHSHVWIRQASCSPSPNVEG